MSARSLASGLPFVIPDGDDPEIVQLIESWRYRGPGTDWSEIVGHTRQVARCHELIEMLRRSDEELSLLGLRPGRGLVMSGAPGTGKTLLARATATAVQRPAIIPPTSELTPGLITRLYAQLGKMEPTVVILDEAEVIIGPLWSRTGDGGALQALLAALDGINTPESGPITIALTTADPSSLDPGAVRPGRLAPTLYLEPPTPAERWVLLAKAIEGLPVSGDIDLNPIVERTSRWTGAELAGAVEEACARSLVDHTDALRQDLLLAVVSEKYVVRDETPAADILTEATAIHEISHGVFAEAVWPGSVAAIEILPGRGGQTHTSDALDLRQTARDIRESIAFSLAGRVGEELCLGLDGVGRDNGQDQTAATIDAMRLVELELSYSPSVLERISGSDGSTGSEHMRAEIYASVVRHTEAGRRRAVEVLTPRKASIRHLSSVLLNNPGGSVSGSRLRSVLRGDAV